MNAYLFMMIGMRLEERRVLLDHQLGDIEVGWFAIGKESAAHDDTFKNSRIV